MGHIDPVDVELLLNPTAEIKYRGVLSVALAKIYGVLDKLVKERTTIRSRYDKSGFQPTIESLISHYLHPTYAQLLSDYRVILLGSTVAADFKSRRLTVEVNQDSQMVDWHIEL